MARKKQKNEISKSLIIAGIVLVLIIFGFNMYLVSQIKAMQQAQKQDDIPMMGKPMSKMGFTEFDKQKAREFMDKNNDGKCDICGMPIDQCIASGMIQCSGMDPNATMGVLGSQHIHADWKIYFEGKPFDWNPYAERHHKQMMGDKSIMDTSAFLHIHPAEESEKGGDVLHMHATGVPLSMLFESLGMRFESDCLTINDKKHCGIKIYVNGKENSDLGAYVFNDLDKILITDSKTEEQMKSITSFAEAH